MLFRSVDVAPEEKKLLGINEKLVRLSIGLENADDLIKVIEMAFEKVK